MPKQEEREHVSFRLSKELDDWVNDQIESGRFESRSQAVEESLVLLQEKLWVSVN